jgi:hypothetical protein
MDGEGVLDLALDFCRVASSGLFSRSRLLTKLSIAALLTETRRVTPNEASISSGGSVSGLTKGVVCFKVNCSLPRIWRVFVWNLRNPGTKSG